MKMHATCVLVVLLIAAATGCRRDPQLAVYLDAVNAEKRMLEDRLYELQHKYDEAQRELDRLKEDQDSTRPAPPRSRRTRPEPEVDELPPPKIELPPGSGDDDLDLRPPTIDPGEPSKPTTSSAAQRRSGRMISQRTTPAGAPRVARIVVDPTHTEGVDRDGRAGDDGLRLALVPLDDDGRFLPQAAPVTVELYDEHDPEEPVAAWEYTREETELALHRADVGRGIRLQMKLPPVRRTHSDYRVRVIYDPDGPNRLAVEHRVALAPHAEPSSRWTPRGAD